jgi:hypothetical protein
MVSLRGRVSLISPKSGMRFALEAEGKLVHGGEGGE